MKIFKTVLIFSVPLWVYGQKSIGYKPQHLVYRIDKSRGDFIDRPIRETDKAFIKDYREVELVGQVFSNKELPTVLPKEDKAPSTILAAMGNFLFVSKKQDVKAIVLAHDSSSQHFVDSSLRKESTSFFNYYKTCNSFKVRAIFETPNFIIVFDEIKRGEKFAFRPTILTVEKNVFKVKAGEIDMSFFIQYLMADTHNPNSNSFLWK